MWGLLLLFLKWIGIDFVPLLARMLSTDVAALNLLLSIFMCYLLAYVYQKYIRGISSNEYVKHIYFIVTGLDMAYYNFGITLYHNLIPPIILYFTNRLLGPGLYHCLITFSFNMIYLIAGYIYTESENYDITWTMPQCVSTLKLIALSFDMWDGVKVKKEEEISSNQKKTAIVQPPSLIQIMGYVYFPACVLIGPLFSFKRYSDFVNDMFPMDDENAKKERSDAALKTFGSGILCLVFYQVLGSYFYMDFMLSEKFDNYSLFYRHIYNGIWSYIALSKYISCWLLTEGACIVFGLSYNGKIKDKTCWDACRNVKLERFITSTKFQHYIDSFNCNTNYFAAEYIYKRLKFMGNKNASQALTLLFLAVWHGVNSGYYATFLNEFLLIFFEKQFEDMLKKTVIYDALWSTPFSRYATFVFLKLYTLIYMGWSLTPFDLKVESKWVYLYSKLWFSGYILFVPWAFCYKPLLKILFKKLNLYKQQ